MLMQIAQELQLEVKRTTRKHELKRLIVEQLVDEDVLPMEPYGQFEIRQLEIKRELKLREFEARESKLEAQKYEKELKHEREMRALELNANRIANEESIATKFELVPEAYCQKFRNYRKQESPTHVEFAHEKEMYFDRWCNCREVGTDFEKLRQVILIEEFKRFVCDDIKTYLDKEKVENLATAAADDYVLTHKSTFNKNTSFGPAKKSYPEVGRKCSSRKEFR